MYKPYAVLLVYTAAVQSYPWYTQTVHVMWFKSLSVYTVFAVFFFCCILTLELKNKNKFDTKLNVTQLLFI